MNREIAKVINAVGQAFEALDNAADRMQQFVLDTSGISFDTEKPTQDRLDPLTPGIPSDDRLN